MTLKGYTIHIRCAITLIVFLSGCKNSNPHIPTGSSGLTSEKSAGASLPLDLPTDSTDRIFQGLHAFSAVLQFYRSVEYRSVWSTHLVASAEADTLMDVIWNTRYYGLLPTRYHTDELGRLGISPQARMRKEVLLTDAFLTLAQDLRYGMRPVHSSEKDSLAVRALSEGLTRHQLRANLAQQEPSLKGYRELKKALGTILDTAAFEDRLLLLGGFTPDSIPEQTNIRHIEVNLERWRREGNLEASRHIFINIPSFMLQVVDSGRTILESKVIVGLPKKQTPQLTSIVECISIYPYWHVPRKIAIEEYLPAIRRDTSFLRRNHFEVLNSQGKILNPDSVAWSKFSRRYFPVSLRQREGTENALGVIKFLFNNPYAVFLHDTNAKRLFRAKVRAFSHGCIRMEKAEQLAHYLTTESIDKKSPTIEKYLKQRRQHIVNLANPISIYVRYFTCAVSQGELITYSDLYNNDPAVEALLYGAVNQTPEVRPTEPFEN